MEAKYKLKAAELAEGIADLNIDDQAPLTRRPKKTSAYETLRKVGMHVFVLLHACSRCPYYSLISFVCHYISAFVCH